MTHSTELATSKSPLSSLPPDQLSVLLKVAEKKLEQRRTENALKYYKPYSKQREFHDAGLKKTQRLFMAGNQLGKTWAGGFETAMHLSGRYPDWWRGRRFDSAVRFWCSGKDRLQHREAAQAVLLGPPETEALWGTGTIPKDAIDNVIRANGIRNAVDTITVRHVTGGISSLGFKSYDMDRQSWQGPTLHGVWFDEEPPEDIYTEGLTRTNKYGQFGYITFTPLLGMSLVVERFLLKATDDMTVVQMTIDDVEHYSDEHKARIIASYPAHEREARARGVPIMGSGRVFPVAEHLVRCDPFPIPDWWPCVGGLDFGWDHPFAAVRLAWDRDADCVYVTHIFRQRESTPLVHAAALKPWGDWFPWAWPHDGLQHDKTSGKPLADHYREHGMKLHFEHAQFPANADGTPGGAGVEAGITMMLERMEQGRLKVFATCGEWFEEFRMYHRKEGLIVKERDDLMSATRYALMMLRIAQYKQKAPNMDKYARRRKHNGETWLTT